MGKLIFAVVATIVLLLSLAFATSTHAATFSGNKDYCENLSSVALDAAQLRDQGVPWEAYKSWMDAQLEYAMASGQSYVQTDQDAAYVGMLIKRVFDEANVQASDAAKKVLASCMKTDARLML